MNRHTTATLLFATLLLMPARVFARPVTSVPPLPAPSGTVVNVSTEAQLQSAVQNLKSNTTIVIAPGTYTLSGTLYVKGPLSNVGIRGATNNRDDVVLVGPGMTRASYGTTPFGIWTGDGVNGILIANLTIREIYYHPIIFNAGTQAPRVYNVHLVNAGQQFIKSNPDASGNGNPNGIVEYSVIEYTSTAPSYYTNGVDVHGGSGWIIRHNLFRNIVGPPGQLAGPAVLMWNHSRDTITEGNSFVNCARAIAYGLQDISGTDHSGGIIRNNFVFRGSGQSGDNGIGVMDSPNTQVLNNTIFLSGTYSSPIEYRFGQTTGVVIANNITDGTISGRDGATGTVTGNLAGASASLFVNAAAGDLHLAPNATSAIDRGVTTGAVTDDWDGELRPQGNGYDIGADERGATSASFQIGGHVTDGTTGKAMSGVAVGLSGARVASTTTDSNGAFAFSGLAGGVSYTVTPSRSGYKFSPDSSFFASLAANQTTDFMGIASQNVAPTVSLSTNGTTFNAPASVTCTAAASDSDGSITKVEFYSGTTLIGTDTSAPFSITWSNVAAGTYALTALATDNQGATTRSAAVSVTVNGPTTNPPTSNPPSGNQAPTISLTAPANGAVYSSRSFVTIRASVSDADGRIRRVQFYAGKTLIGSDSFGPSYSMTWRYMAPGSYSLTAVATDDDGATTRSAPVTITVRR